MNVRLLRISLRNLNSHLTENHKARTSVTKVRIFGNMASNPFCLYPELDTGEMYPKKETYVKYHTT